MEDIRTRPISSIEGAGWRRQLPQAFLLVLLLAALALFVIVPFTARPWLQAGNMSGGSALEHFYLPYLVGLVYLMAGVWVFTLRRGYASGRAFAAFAAAVALALGLRFDFSTARGFAGLWILALGQVGGAAVVYALAAGSRGFGRGAKSAQLPARFRIPAWAGVMTGLLLAMPPLFGLRAGQSSLSFEKAPLPGLPFLIGFSALALLFMVVWFFMHTRRDQGLVTALAAAVSFLPAVVWAARALFLRLELTTGAPAPLLAAAAVFPIVSVISVQRYRLIQADAALSLGIRYGMLSVLVAAGYALITAGLGLALGPLAAPNQPLVTGFVFVVLALLLNPLREGVQRVVDQVFFRNKRIYQDRLQTFSGELTREVDLPGILGVLRRYVSEAIAPTRMHIFIYDALSDQYAAVAGADPRSDSDRSQNDQSKGDQSKIDRSGSDLRSHSDLRFPITSGLAIRLSEQRAPLLLNEYDTLPAALESDRARLILLGAQVCVPLPGRQRLSGWLALGPRPTGEPYTAMQLGFAEALCDQAALAIERAQVIANMENRVREMNVLSRVAQGINFTLTLDDILELVYAQTTQILPGDFFHIMLYERDLDVYRYAFLLERDDRLQALEERPVPAGQALEQEIIRQRRPIRSDDFQRECQRRGVMCPSSGQLAWMGVPLNAGAETIGALSISSSNPGVEYTSEQQALLQSIADQVAGALVKARLLQETQRRARQLTTLNEVTRQLTSTLETEPLLQSILQSAVDILNCEAGSLLLVEDQGDSLVFRSVVGPVASNLLNARMPADRGVVGKAVQKAEPLIVNDVSRFPEWFSKPDQDTGFLTRSVLVIPLIVKERVIGVVEVINKKDGTIFTRDDQDLLSAFASQAAVAMENARLYTNTDQALAARVEELSVMQRIDRELNASLEPARAMRITLDWAMRQSGAQAGLVGILVSDGAAAANGEGTDTGAALRVMAYDGYGKEIEAYANGLLPAAEYGLQEAVESGLPHRHLINIGNSLTTAPLNPARALLIGGRSQAVIPIRRETNTIGVLLLESRAEQHLSDEAMSFLIRLSDHASIAISNAQLYTEVQQANLAKSDFVSFVAHELKNPMTSVKGYTELISAGAVGPINDAQSNFLGTIRANIERMNTLVSDLNDMSKIEVGRLRLDFKSLKLSDSIETVVRSTRRQIEEKGQVLSLEISGDLPPVWADRVRLEQVLVNLVSNAHKYTSNGGVIEVAAEACANQWDPSGAKQVLHVSVKDNGIGIAEEDQKKIFQKFFRSDDPKTREVTGTGLGLNITRSLVEMQGGRIWFDSEFRKGTTFHFTIPVSES